MTNDTNNLTFRALALALAPYTTGTMDNIRAVDAVLAAGFIPDPTPSSHNPVTNHETLVTMALASPDIADFVQSGQKFHAIKELRYLSFCGLKEAKEAIEDSRVWS